MEFEIVNSFVEFEENEGMFDLSLRGVLFWDYIRLSMFRQVADSKGEINHAVSQEKKRFLYGIPGFVGALCNPRRQINLFLRNPLWCTKVDLLIVNHARKIRDEKGDYVCRYTGFIDEKDKWSKAVLEYPIQWEHLQPTNNRKLFYLDFLYALFRICKKAYAYLCPFNSNEKEFIEQKICVPISKQFSASVDTEKISVIIRESIIADKVVRKCFSWLLTRIKPKTVIIAVAYDMLNKALCKAAKERSIPSIEMQHGIMGRFGLSYNYARPRKLPTFPEHIIVWGNYWKKSSRFPIPQDRIFVGGYPFYEKKVMDVLSRVAKPNKKELLFLSQYCLGDQMLEVANKLHALVGEEYRILFKLHPKEYPQIEHFSKNALMEVLSDKVDLYELFARSSAVVSVASTGMFEALPFKTKLMILPLYAYQYMEDLVKEGFARIVKDEQEIVSALREFRVTGSPEEFWQGNGAEKTVAALTAIVSNQRGKIA